MTEAVYGDEQINYSLLVKYCYTGHMSELHGYVDTIIGLSRGDEAKGRFAEELAREGEYAIVARFNGGDNAGHTASFHGQEVNTNQIPMGVLVPGVRNLITKSSYVNPDTLLGEIERLRMRGVQANPGNIGVSDTAHLILPHHIILDKVREQSKGRQGSTSKGISFVAAEKYERSGLRVENLQDDTLYVEEVVVAGLIRANEALKHAGLPQVDVVKELRRWYARAVGILKYVTDTTEEIAEALSDEKNVLAEGAQSFGLDIEHGSYPNVTSSHTTIGGMMNSFVVGADAVRNVYGVAKLLKSSVGAPLTAFPTVIRDEEIASRIGGVAGEIDAEYGKSTGRQRDVGWFDIPEINRALQINKGNGRQELFLSKLDCVPRAGKTALIAVGYSYKGKFVSVSPADSIKKLAECKPVYHEFSTWDTDISAIRTFDDLPSEAKKLVTYIEEATNTPVTRIGVGPHPGQFVRKD